jgi:dipicolinate synthase subunit B
VKNLRIGVGITGSFCMFETVFCALEALHAHGAALTFVLSYHAQELASRFGTPAQFLQRMQPLSAAPPVLSIPDAEPLGPAGLLDLFLIAPCTGNTLAKLAGGITDTPVLMAAKGHLRNNKPLVLFLATNDALSANLKNIGILLNAKYITFVPFAQDAPFKKPNSLVSQANRLEETLAAAMQGEQVQPLLGGGAAGR